MAPLPEQQESMGGHDRDGHFSTFGHEGEKPGRDGPGFLSPMSKEMNRTKQRRLYHSIIGGATLFCYVCAALLLDATLVAPAAQAAALPRLTLAQGAQGVSAPTGLPGAEAADLAGCQDLSAEELRTELNRVSQQVFATGQGGLQLETIVAQQWVALQVGSAFDQAVDDAIAQVRANSDIWNQFLSGWSPSAAEELTRQTATLVFQSEGLNLAMEQLAEGIAAAVAAEVAAVAAASASAATLCLHGYIGNQYSNALVAAFAQEVQAEMAAMDLNLDENLDSGIMTVIRRHQPALGGIGVIIASQIAKRVVQNVGRTISRRVAGKVVGRVIGRAGSAIIPAVGWVVGAGLIVYDVIESREGALPQIRAGLQSIETKTLIQAEIAAAVAPELQSAAPQIAREIANDLYASWLDFNRKYRQVLALAESDPAFRVLLATNEDLGALANWIDTALATVGREELNRAIGNGQLGQVLALPASAVDILRATGDFGVVIAWGELAGGRLDDVARLELYKHKSPGSISRNQLASLLALDDPVATAKLALLEAETLAPLLTISTAHLRQLANLLAPSDLAWLGFQRQQLGIEATNQLITYLLENPALVSHLKAEAVRSRLATPEQAAQTVALLVRPATPLGLLSDWLLLITGRVEVGLYAYKYGVLLTALVTAVPILLVLALLYSLFLWLFAPIAALMRLIRRVPRPVKRPPAQEQELP
jgi:hypothetical protein